MEFYTFIEPVNTSAPIDFSTKIDKQEILTEILHFIYADALSSPSFKGPFLIDLMKASDYLNLIKLKLTVESLLCTRITVSNCGLLIQLSLTLTAEMLFEHCLNYFIRPGISTRVMNDKKKSWEGFNLSNDVSYPGLQSVLFKKVTNPLSIQSIPISSLSVEASTSDDDQQILSLKRKRAPSIESDDADDDDDDDDDNDAVDKRKFFETMTISQIRTKLQSKGCSFSDMDGSRGVIERVLIAWRKTLAEENHGDEGNGEGEGVGEIG